MNASFKLAHLVRAASSFEKKEIMVTVTGPEMILIKEWLDLLVADSAETVVGFKGQFTDLNVSSITYQGVTIHFNVV